MDSEQTQPEETTTPRVHAIFAEDEDGNARPVDIPEGVADKSHSVKCYARDNVPPPFVVVKIIGRGRAVSEPKTVVE